MQAFYAIFNALVLVSSVFVYITKSQSKYGSDNDLMSCVFKVRLSEDVSVRLFVFYVREDIVLDHSI